MIELDSKTAEELDRIRSVHSWLVRAHRMSCSDPDDPKRVTTYSQSADAITRLLSAVDAVIAECGATDTDTDEALQGDLVNRIEAAISKAIGTPA
ncbi:hypothetical protein HTS88_20965 [Pseudarthrobacter oxydans]|uniref:hypothetical protein n=1 Tax=Pseudarthrobacter oxydans TaxID=1671 RepID=UPI0015716839|nr:hypothetical protein [Pseudarthrobacter oxydans]NSX38853.1 hypothetical protein [Pseudarthrobacter oxydans]